MYIRIVCACARPYAFSCQRRTVGPNLLPEQRAGTRGRTHACTHARTHAHARAHTCMHISRHVHKHGAEHEKLSFAMFVLFAHLARVWARPNQHADECPHSAVNLGADIRVRCPYPAKDSMSGDVCPVSVQNLGQTQVCTGAHECMHAHTRACIYKHARACMPHACASAHARTRASAHAGQQR